MQLQNCVFQVTTITSLVFWAATDFVILRYDKPLAFGPYVQQTRCDVSIDYDNTVGVYDSKQGGECSESGCDTRKRSAVAEVRHSLELSIITLVFLLTVIVLVFIWPYHSDSGVIVWLIEMKKSGMKVLQQFDWISEDKL